MFHERLMKLRQQIGRTQPIPLHMCVGKYHGILDSIDKEVGINTRHGHASAYYVGASRWPTTEYAGARLARLERHVEGNKTPALFWLGAEGDSDG